MSEQNTEFENWYNNKLAECRTNNDMVLHKKLFQYTDFYKHGYEAATAEANKRIEALEREVANLRLNIKAQEQLGYELQANNHDLREALLAASKYVDHLDPASIICKIISEALSATPAESLAKRDDEVIEKCAKVCDEAHENETIGHWQTAQAIRALKGK